MRLLCRWTGHAAGHGPCDWHGRAAIV